MYKTHPKQHQVVHMTRVAVGEHFTNSQNYRSVDRSQPLRLILPCIWNATIRIKGKKHNVWMTTHDRNVSECTVEWQDTTWQTSIVSYILMNSYLLNNTYTIPQAASVNIFDCKLPICRAKLSYPSRTWPFNLADVLIRAMREMI